MKRHILFLSIFILSITSSLWAAQTFHVKADLRYGKEHFTPELIFKEGQEASITMDGFTLSILAKSESERKVELTVTLQKGKNRIGKESVSTHFNKSELLHLGTHPNKAIVFLNIKKQ